MCAASPTADCLARKRSSRADEPADPADLIVNTTSTNAEPKSTGTERTVAVVVPCYRVREQILEVLAGIGDEVAFIYVVDDACPDDSGALVEERCSDARVRVIRHEQNRGVGGAVMTGYRAALEDGAEVIVKLDGDGQMDPRMIGYFVQPILAGEADYTKGNRFFELEGLKSMPPVRLFGNSVLTLITKASSGYWNINDPTNGFTAIHAELVKRLPLRKLDERYFFESDILFRIGTLRGVVTDMPMTASYGDEASSLVPRRIIGVFLRKNFSNTIKRLFYGYLLRDFNAASVQIVTGILFVLFGTIYGAGSWMQGSRIDTVSSSGVVMIAAMPIILGVQLLLSFLNFDVQNVPRQVLHLRLAPMREKV